MVEKRFFKADGSEVQLHDTEDKNWWIAYGEDKEHSFLTFCQDHGILEGLMLNPERKGGMKRGAPEFVLQGSYLDVKVQHQPFFEAQQRFSIPPRYAVTLNWRDVEDVRVKYNDCIIIYWVNWTRLQYIKTRERKTKPRLVLADITVAPLHGVWYMNPEMMFLLENEAIRDGRHHWYGRRYLDTKGNAKSSYVIDIRRMDQIWIDPSCPPIEPI